MSSFRAFGSAGLLYVVVPACSTVSEPCMGICRDLKQGGFSDATPTNPEKTHQPGEHAYTKCCSKNTVSNTPQLEFPKQPSYPNLRFLGCQSYEHLYKAKEQLPTILTFVTGLLGFGMDINSETCDPRSSISVNSY